jgi:hypothetical protein
MVVVVTNGSQLVALYEQTRCKSGASLVVEAAVGEPWMGYKPLVVIGVSARGNSGVTLVEEAMVYAWVVAYMWLSLSLEALGMERAQQKYVVWWQIAAGLHPTAALP